MYAKLVIIGGGAAGIFAAIAAKEANPHASIVLLEKTAVLLSKVRISGGGRCNVTHACFDPYRLVQHYPRGSKELIGPFHRFQPRDTMDWFESRGVSLATEEDGRVFPSTNRSETIIECLLTQAQNLGVEILLRQRIQHIVCIEDGFTIELNNGQTLSSRSMLLATGSSSEGYTWAQHLGHSIQEPAPSLFTFNIPHFALKELSGISLEQVRLHIVGSSLTQEGPLLLTHFGLSGPVALRLSAWGARYLKEKDYRVTLAIHWISLFSQQEIFYHLSQLKTQAPDKLLQTENVFRLPKNLWRALLESLAESARKCIHDLTLRDLRLLSHKLYADHYQVEGKTTNKEEFVTCGGVTLKEIDFKTMQSKICPGLFFAGEMLDIDGITGGFNFQNAWTTGFIAGTSASTF